MQTLTMTPAPVSDEALVQAYTAGTSHGFDELMRRYAGPVFAFCLRMVGRPEDAEDLTQDVFVQLLKSLPDARTDAPIRPWIFVIARNKCLDHLKRRRPLPFSAVTPADEPAPAIADERPLPEELAERADLQHLLQREIAALPDHYRAVVTLRYASELSFAEIGSLLRLPENTVKTHFQRAKALLRGRLATAA